MKKIWKTVVSMILILGCIAGTFSAIAVQSKPESTQLYGTAIQFRDVPSDAWYYNDVAIAVQSGWMKGTSATTFDPLALITIAEIAQILENLDAVVDNTPPDERNYSDVPSNAWYFDVMMKYGIHFPWRGDRNTGGVLVRPEVKIARCEVAYALLSGSGCSDNDITEFYKKLTGDYETFFVRKRIPEAALIVMNKLGIISGYENGDLGNH
jgi:hypothetical protein